LPSTSGDPGHGSASLIRQSCHFVALQSRLPVLAAQIARALPGLCPLLSKRAQGRPGADLAPAVCCAKMVRRKTAQQHTGGANHSAFPAQWFDGLCRALPGAEFLLASLAPRIGDAVDPVGRSTPPQQLGRSNDGQDHTVLPYARPACSPHYLPGLSTLPEECRRDEPQQRRSSTRGFGLTGTTRPARYHRAQRCPRPPQARLANKTTRDRPSRMSRDERHIRNFRISVKWNIFAGRG
jgi:hypothetical protein